MRCVGETNAAILPRMVVVVDRTGADIEAYGRHGEHLTEREVKGSRTYPIHKTDQGGWSQASYQRRAENVWEHNTKEVAEEIDRGEVRRGARPT